MRVRGDPVENLKRGIIYPVLRSLSIVLLTLIIALSASVVLGSGDWFWAFMIGSLPILWLIERGRKTQIAREKKARDQFLGIDDSP